MRVTFVATALLFLLQALLRSDFVFVFVFVVVLFHSQMPAPLAPSGNPAKETYDVLRILGFNR